MNFRSCCALTGAFAVFTCLARPAAAQYTVTDIGPNLSYAGLNNRGQILASSYDSTTKKNALYLITGSSRELVSAKYANAYFNDAGQVAYTENTYPAISPLYLYTNGVKTVLSPAGYFTGLSDNGNVIWNNNGHGFLYSGGLAHDLGAYTVTAVNNSGQVTGYAVGPHGANAVYLYQNGQWSLAVDAPYYNVFDPYTSQTYTGYQSVQPVGLTNSGKIFIETGPNYAYSRAAPMVYVYDIVAAKFIAQTSYYSPYASGYGGTFDGLFFNQRGDYGSSYLTATTGPGRRDLASIVINGKTKDPLAGISSPPQTAGPFIILNSLNNRGQCLYTVNNITAVTPYFYDGTTGNTVNPSTLLGLPANSPYGSLSINDAEQIAFTLVSGGVSHLYLATPSGTVSGTVALDSIAANAPAQNITFDFRDTTDYPLFTRTASVGPDGAFTVTGVAAGFYHVRVKGDTYLAQVVTVGSNGGAVTGVNVALPGGDADNNNVVDIGDFGILVGSYTSDKAIAGSGYDPSADFNGDGKVDIGDFGILVNNYNAVGAD